MLVRRLLPVLAAALLLPTAASARGLTVHLPASVAARVLIPVTWQGDTGPGDLAPGGFVVQNRIVMGDRRCPAAGVFNPGWTVFEGGDANLIAAGAFAGATRIAVRRPGRYRLCGYLSTNAEALTYELLVDAPFTVDPKATGPRRARATTIKDGIYTAVAAAITGGTPASSLSFRIAGGTVVSASATGIPRTGCLAGAPVSPVPGSFANPEGDPVANAVVGFGFDARFLGAAPNGSITLSGGGRSAREIRGVVATTSADGLCSGGFAYVAQRA